MHTFRSDGPPKKGELDAKRPKCTCSSVRYIHYAQGKKENAVISSRIHADGIGGDYYSEQASRNSNEAQKQYAQGQLLADCR